MSNSNIWQSYAPFYHVYDVFRCVFTCQKSFWLTTTPAGHDMSDETGLQAHSTPLTLVPFTYNTNRQISTGHRRVSHHVSPTGPKSYVPCTSYTSHIVYDTHHTPSLCTAQLDVSNHVENVTYGGVMKGQ